jgi:hypothetical protein
MPMEKNIILILMFFRLNNIYIDTKISIWFAGNNGDIHMSHYNILVNSQTFDEM